MERVATVEDAGAAGGGAAEAAEGTLGLPFMVADVEGEEAADDNLKGERVEVENDRGILFPVKVVAGIIDIPFDSVNECDCIIFRRKKVVFVVVVGDSLR